MCDDVSFDSGVAVDYGWNELPLTDGMTNSSDSAYHEAIFSPPSHLLFYNSPSYRLDERIPSRLDHKMSQIAANRSIAPSLNAESGTSWEFGYEYSWGAKDDDGSGSFYGRGEVHDDDGYYIEGEIRQAEDGSGKAGVRGGKR